MTWLFESLSSLSFRDPWLLIAAVLLPLGLWLRYRRGSPPISFAPGSLIRDDDVLQDSTPMPRSWREWCLPVPRTLQTAGMLLLVIAIARPEHRVQLPLESSGIDILLCLDTSSSMTANDMDEVRTRLDLARQAATRFIAGRPDDRIGLIRFARYPDVLCPLTLDQDALNGFLADLSIVDPDGQEDLTGIGTAVARAAQVLGDSLGKSKVVILLTDGEENVATTESPDEIGPLRAARLCEALGVRVYTIAAGIGAQNQAGEWEPVDTSQVERLAELTGGEFFAARDADAINQVYDTIDEMEKVVFEEPRFELVEWFLPFLLTALGLLVMARVLECTVLEVLP